MAHGPTAGSKAPAAGEAGKAAVGDQGNDVLESVSRATRLREGPEGVRAILRAIAQGGELATRQVATTVRLPLPVVAAVRGELTRLGLCEHRAHGVALTDRGREFAERVFGHPTPASPRQCVGPGGGGAVFVETLASFAALRPPADVALDQAKATPETLARRVAYLDANDAIAGRRILCLGDDDFVSVAIAAWCEFERERGRTVQPACVLVADVDRRILDAIAGLGQAVEVLGYDARDPVPDELRDGFDVVVTDPPYTLHGAELFLSRAVDAVGARAGTRCFLSFGHLDPAAMRGVQGSLVEMGWVVREWLPGFNRYEGSSVLAGISLMAHLVLADGANSVVQGRYDGPLYTGEVRPVLRIYRCQGCSAEWEVGPGRRWPTVAHLKRQSCPVCGADRFRRVGQRPTDQSQGARRS